MKQRLNKREMYYIVHYWRRIFIYIKFHCDIFYESKIIQKCPEFIFLK